MADKKVIIIDETQDEEQDDISPEELEELLRKERLKKLFKKRKTANTSLLYNVSKIVNVIGILGIMLGMFLESGGVSSFFLIVIFISSIVNYLCFK